MKKRILSGIQPSGKLHLGNYFGAIKQHIDIQNEQNADPYYFIANFHAMTTLKNGKELRENTLDVAVDYLALGLDPEKSVFFRQSDVPEVQELAWILACQTGMKFLERAHSYKDKVAKGLNPNVGLFYYPVLMAADILIYRSNVVPVGKDQQQHVEMAQDMAAYFNNTYNTNVLIRPEWRFSPTPKVPGTDGDKMSKSYGNTIDIQDEGKKLKKSVMGIVTDSRSVEASKDPESCNVFAIYKLFASEDEIQELSQQYRAGGTGYGQAKKMLLKKVEEHFAPYREKRQKLLDNLGSVEEVLFSGAKKARAVALETLEEVREVCGV